MKMVQQRKLDTYKPGSNYKVLVTAALEYATGDIHPGHLKSTFLPPHQLNSYLGMRQRYFSNVRDGRAVDSVFIGGLDCHGIHVAMKAKEEDMSVWEFITKSADEHQKLLKKAGIKFTHYAPTHIPENRELVEKAFESMRGKGYLVEKEVDAVHCNVCGYNPPPKDIETPPMTKISIRPGLTVVHEGSDTNSDALLPRVFDREMLEYQQHKDCGESSRGKLVYLEGLKHYHLNLEKLKPEILEFLRGVQTLEPERKFQIKNFQGREPWDFTREDNWGWPIPGVTGKKQFYVWFDAPFGYISALKNYFRGETRRFREFTQGENALMFHHLGKDISTHHHILWPAMLIAYNSGVPDSEKINLPAGIFIRGHLDVYQRGEDGNILRDKGTNKPLTEKMSKSKRNAPPLEEIVHEHGADMVSFYLTLTNPLSPEDTVYDGENLIEAKDLFANKIGNFVNRTLSLIKKKSQNKIPPYIDNLLDEKDERYEVDQEFISVNKSIFETVGRQIERGDHKNALDEIVNFATKANQYIDGRAPWDKSLDEGERSNILYLCANTVKNLSLLLRPYMPNMSEKIRDMLNVEYEWMWSDEGQIDLQSGQEIGKIEHLVESSQKGKGTKKIEKRKRVNFN